MWRWHALRDRWNRLRGRLDREDLDLDLDPEAWSRNFTTWARHIAHRTDAALTRVDTAMARKEAAIVRSASPPPWPPFDAAFARCHRETQAVLEDLARAVGRDGAASGPKPRRAARARNTPSPPTRSSAPQAAPARLAALLQTLQEAVTDLEAECAQVASYADGWHSLAEKSVLAASDDHARIALDFEREHRAHLAAATRELAKQKAILAELQQATSALGLLPDSPAS